MKPKVYTLEDHSIPPEKVDRHAYYVIQKLKEAGYEAYLVGGGVRDLLLNTRPKDFDISTSAKPEEVKSLFGNCLLIGRRFRLAHVRFGRKILEVSTFRSGDNESSDLIVRDNIWGSAEEDAKRRDFTINGLFYDPEQQTITDYVNGYPDIKKKVLRTIGEPAVRFKQDPVRMIRLAKFIARFDLGVDSKTHDALIETRGEIIKSSSPRILEELMKMLESGASEAFFLHLSSYGLLKPLLPRLAEYMQRDNLICNFLEELDIETKKNYPKSLPRSLCLSALIYPLFEEGILQLSPREKKTLHLGTISHLAALLIDTIFQPFFRIPKRIRMQVIFILSSQFKVTPLDEHKTKRIRVPRDSCFSHAMELFKMRAALDPGLLEKYTNWTEAVYRSHKKAPRKTRKRVRHD